MPGYIRDDSACALPPTTLSTELQQELIRQNEDAGA